MRARLATIVLVGAAVIGAGGLGAACSSDSTPNVAPQPKGDDAELATGRTVYVANCQRCHGPRGQGGIGSILSGRVTRSFPNIQNQINVVTNGPGAMPAFGDTLTAAEIRAVVRYTREVL